MSRGFSPIADTSRTVDLQTDAHMAVALRLVNPGGERGPNQVVSASASPGPVESPTQARYSSGLINTAVGSGTTPITACTLNSGRLHQIESASHITGGAVTLPL